MTLHGGTLALGGQSEGGPGSNGVGALTLGANSTIDFAVGVTTSIIQFAGLGSHAVGAILQITNWDGTPYTGGGAERLFFAGSTTDFTNSYSQADVMFNGVAGYNAVQIAPGYYEITAVPEPTTWVAGALALGALAFTQRRRLAKRRA
jgi:MYXO-CTERM domain-containing protein